MSIQPKSERLSWKAGEHGAVPFSERFGDSYFSAEDGRAETEAVFLAGNGLPGRWRQAPRFTIAELGFGTGLNFFVTSELWQQAAPPACELTFVSFERYPLLPDEMRRAIKTWPDLMAQADLLLADWPPPPGWAERTMGGVKLVLAIGDAADLLPQWRGKADAWFLDGFAPAKNPQLWTPDLMRAVFDKTSDHGTFSTYTSAGHVRRALEDAGFSVEKVPGFGRKRHRLQGRLNGQL